MPRNDPSIEDIFREAMGSHAFRLEAAKIEFTEEMVKRIDDLGISKSMLADRIGTSPAYVTKILRGSTNFTLESMVKIADALDADLRCHIAPKGAETLWIDCPPTGQTLRTEVSCVPGEAMLDDSFENVDATYVVGDTHELSAVA